MSSMEEHSLNLLGCLFRLLWELHELNLHACVHRVLRYAKSHCPNEHVLLYVSVPAGYGFVDFDSPSSAQKAVTALKAGGVQAQMAKVRIPLEMSISGGFISYETGVSLNQNCSSELNFQHTKTFQAF